MKVTRAKATLVAERSNGIKGAHLHDTLAALTDEVIAPLEFLSTLLKTYSETGLAFESKDLRALGQLLDALCRKAESILTENLGESNAG